MRKKKKNRGGGKGCCEGGLEFPLQKKKERVTRLKKKKKGLGEVCLGKKTDPESWGGGGGRPKGKKMYIKRSRAPVGSKRRNRKEARVW